MKNRLRNILLSLITTCPGVVASLHSHAQAITAEQNYAANSPGVAMVQNVFSATVYVNKVEMNEERFRKLVDSVQLLDTTGTLLPAERKLDIVVHALYNNPIRFLNATEEYYRQQHRILSAGTGFFISGDGYLFTNCHIIDRDSAYIRQKFILSTFQEVIDANLRSLQSSWAMTLTDEQRALLYNAYSVIYAQVSSMILFDLRQEIYVQFRTLANDNALAIRRLPAHVVIKGKPMPGKDVAILKVDSVKEMPSLQLSAEPVPRIGGQVLVYGYPEPVTSNIFLDRETTSEPTLTAGIISAIKKSIGGWPVIQMDAVISHGSSGSPVCNDEGKVIGIATFGTLEQNTGILATGYNFAIPLSVVREFLDSAQVQLQPSISFTDWQEGLDYFYRGYFFKALGKFKAVKKRSDNYPQVAYYIDACDKRIAAGDDHESFLQKEVFRILAVLLLIVGVYVFLRWRKAN